MKLRVNKTGLLIGILMWIFNIFMFYNMFFITVPIHEEIHWILYSNTPGISMVGIHIWDNYSSDINALGYVECTYNTTIWNSSEMGNIIVLNEFIAYYIQCLIIIIPICYINSIVFDRIPEVKK